MSTRRARIKAVAALPQRRKNADNSDSKKNQDTIKELAENVIKSPKTQHTSVDKNSSGSPVKASLPSPRKSPRALKRTADLDKVPLDWKVPSPTPVPIEKRSNTPLRDKTDTNKPTPWRSEVFVSPQTRASPMRRRSPVVRTPIIEVTVGVEQSITPHKRLLEMQENANRSDSISDIRDNVQTLKPLNGSGPSNSKHARKLIQDYSSPNTPDTEGVMDGIVPLKPITNAPKPIDLLKNEIISDNVEVLFDPIVPLPSPTKVRQKLRPVPRLGPMRRNSIPGSASESEDESRRALHGGSSTPVPSRQRHDSHTSHSTMQSLPNRDVSRVRNDSVCSSVSLITPQTPAALGSPLKEKNVPKSRRVEVSKRMAAMRRRRESVQRDKLTMFDLIFYNPLGNPIVPDQDEIKAKEANKKEEEESKMASKKEETTEDDTSEAKSDTAAPVPQIKLGPNGEIILDEQSLVINQSEQRKLSDTVVREGSWVSSTGRIYRRAPRTAEWSDAETVRFYRALAALGTDFSLMASLFPGRSRRDLKLKFKKEERTNLSQIDKALRSVTGWDADRLENEFSEERKKAEENEKKLKEQLKAVKQEEKERLRAMTELGIKRSKGARALGSSVLPTTSDRANPAVTADDFLMKVAAAKAKKRVPVEKSLRTPNRPDFATLNKSSKNSMHLKVGIPMLPNKASIQKPKPVQIPSIKPVPQKSPLVINAMPTVPADIAPGSLVVLTVDDPKAPSQKAIHTYIKQSDGSITSVILDPSVMSSLVSYVKNDTPKAGSSTSTMSPSSIVSDTTMTPPIGVNRSRLNSYNITDL